MLLEFKINIKETPEEYVKGLILGLVFSGYEAYFDFEKEHIIFTGYSDEVITNDVVVKEKHNERTEYKKIVKKIS